jgi:serine/threonine-protein kinase
MILQDRYRLLSVLGEGAMGTVYRAERLQLGRQVAVKFLHQWGVADPQISKRFEIEARAMSRLNHPHCVAVTDFGVAGTPYLVMDLVVGQTLKAIIRAGALAPARAIAIARQVLSGLGHAHDQGIVHRDIKPENIVLTEVPGCDDHVRILDFGLAKLMDKKSDLTKGLMVGTPNYMAPEQLRAGTVDARTDVYAAGIVLFEMLTGERPFHSPDVMEVLKRQLDTPPPPLRRADPKGRYSAALEAAVQGALAKAADERFPTAAAFSEALGSVPEAGAVTRRSTPRAAALDRTVQAPAPAAAPALPGGRRRRGRTAVGALSMGIVVTVVVIVGLKGGTRQEHQGPAQAELVPGPLVDPAAPPAQPRADQRERAAKLAADRRPADHPDDAEGAARDARMFFERLWWSEGVAAYRRAIAADSRRAEDPILIGYVISALQSARFHDHAAAFLRELGDPARPLVEKAARDHESPRVRARAASLAQSWR